MEESQPKILEKNSPQRVYLITYSNIDGHIFPTRASFGIACATAFGGNKVLYFACSKEKHPISNGYHYHVAIRLNPPQRWKSAKDYLSREHGVIVNFSSSPNGGMYAGAYRYAAKEDAHIFHGHCLEKHPDLEMIGQNKVAAKANAAYREKRKIENEKLSDEEKSLKNKPKRIKKLDVAEYIREKNITTHRQLMAEIEIRREAGDRELPNFVFNLGKKARTELIEDAWEMHDSVRKEKAAQLDRITVIQDFADMDCNNDCDGLWLQCALDVLSKNEINKFKFATALYELFEKGRGKHRNIILVGESNCAKTFLLEPIATLFPDTFSSPASSTFSWLGVDSAPIILLNDFRWKPLTMKGGIIEWDAFLRLLEGAEVNLPAPMNSCSKHIKIIHDIPIFATSLQEVRFFKRDPDEPQTSRHAIENEMMESRWNVFNLKYKFSKEEKIIDIPKCGSCFSKLVLLSRD